MKEEQKKECECTDECLGYLTQECKGIEEPKKETLEEVAEKYISSIGKLCCISEKEMQDYAKTDFINGAKWQAERMYSEEEVISIQQEWSDFNNNQDSFNGKDDLTFQEWFEQFKKKQL